MKDGNNTKSLLMDINSYLLMFVVIWTAGISVSLGWNIYQLRQPILSAAPKSAKISYDKDFFSRTPPDPYLKVPDREIKTPDDPSPTLINTAYKTRQLNEPVRETHNLQGDITSLNRIRKEGDSRGGISVSNPMEPRRDIERSRMIPLILTHSFLWIIGLTGIGIGARRLWRRTLQREKAEEELLILSITDQLTGLHNRRGFLSLAEQQLRLSDRTKDRMLLFFADLDGLKGINDTLGHQEGDNALIEVAAVLKETFRTSDVIARMGGDEFAVLAIDTTEVNPEVLTIRVQNLIEAHNNLGNRKYRLSISVGCSFYDPENPCSIEELMYQADQLMYEEKRNRYRHPLAVAEKRNVIMINETLSPRRDLSLGQDLGWLGGFKPIQ